MLSALPVLLLLLATARCDTSLDQQLMIDLEYVHIIPSSTKVLVKTDPTSPYWMGRSYGHLPVPLADQFHQQISYVIFILHCHPNYIRMQNFSSIGNRELGQISRYRRFDYKQTLGQVFSEDIQEIIDSVHNDCVEKTGVAEEDIQNCEKGIFKEDEKLKCYMVCLLEEASLVEDDLVDYDMLVSLMPEEMQDRTRTMLYACKHNDTPDKARCQRAFDVHKCSYEKDPDRGNKNNKNTMDTQGGQYWYDRSKT